MAKRFIFALVAFICLVFPGAFGLALVAAPAPVTAPLLEPPGCERNLQIASASVAASEARLQQASAKGGEMCMLTRLYFLEKVKARAVTAACRRGPDRDRELGHLDADVERINASIAAHCH